MFLKPTHPQVPDPELGGYLPAEGRHVEQGPYWWRRIAAGDVVEAEPPPDPPPAAVTSTPPESPPPAGSSVSEARKPNPARKGAQP